MELGPTLACLEAQLWPAGPRIGSFDGATVGIRRGHPGSICLFCCRLQPAPRLAIGQSSLWSCCFGDAALPAACTSLHFQVAAAAAALRQVRARLAWIAPSRLLLQHASTPSRTRTCTYSSSPLHRVRWHLFACREPRTECEVVSFPPSLVHWSIARSAVPAICAVKSRPGLSGCRSLSACHSRQSSCYIRAVPTSQQPIDLSFLFVGSRPCHAFFRLSIHSLPLRASKW